MGNQLGNSASTDDDQIRIVMLGKTGVGKSTIGNTILGQQHFKSEFSPKSLTQHCKKADGEVDGEKIAVIDTPVLFDTNNTEEEIVKELAQCIAYASPGPHIFLVVIKLGRYTEEEKQTVQKIQETFGEEADKHSMVLFTHGDLLKGKSIEEFLEDSEDLQELVRKYKDQYHVFNNKGRFQRKKLLEKIKKIKEENGGRYCDTEMFRNAEKVIEEEKQQILKAGEEQNYKEEEELRKEIEEKYETIMKEYCPPTASNNNDVIRIVMVGKTGAGKSATGNTILGEKCFDSEASFASLTTVCKKVLGEVDGQKVAVIDTPGLFDTKNTEEKTVQDISQSIAYASPGPHIFLVVTKLGRFTKEEKQTVQKIKDIFGEEANKYSMVLFTGGDLLKGTSIDKFVKKSKDLKELVAKCKDQYNVFNNEEKEDRSQVSQLLQKIKKINEQNGGNHYTTEKFQKLETVIEKEKQRILEGEEEEHCKKQKEEEQEIKEKYQKKFTEVEGDREIVKLKEECEKEIANRMKQLKEKFKRDARRKAEESDLVNKVLIKVSLAPSPCMAQPQKKTIQADEQHENQNK